MLTPEARRRWTLILGTAEASAEPSPLNDVDRMHAQLLGALFDQTMGAGQGVSAPFAAKWLKDLQEILPKPVFRWIERECWNRWGPEAVVGAGHHEPDVAIVEMLFGVHLGGGNDTARALDYCSQLIVRPEETLLVLISDLIEGALSRQMIQRLEVLRERNVRIVVLPAITDRGEAQFDQANAKSIGDLGIPVAACTPDEFHRVLDQAWQRMPLSPTTRVVNDRMPSSPG